MQITQHAGEMPNIRNDILVSPGVYSAASCIFTGQKSSTVRGLYQSEMVPKVALLHWGYIYIYSSVLYVGLEAHCNW